VTPTYRSRETSTGSPDPASSFLACKIISRSVLRFGLYFFSLRVLLAAGGFGGGWGVGVGVVGGGKKKVT